MKKQILLTLSILVFAVSAVIAQTSPIKTISSGIINGKAVSLPVPEFPAAAQAVKASGAVSVQVLIDEGGNVIEANAVSGHPLLRQAAEQAARQATFAPTMLSGQPVKVSGVVVYNFGGTNTNAGGSGIGATGFPVVKADDGENNFVGLGSMFSMMKVWANAKNSSNLPAMSKNLSKGFPQLAEDFKPLESLDQNMPENAKNDLINTTFSSIKSKLSAPEAWQFDVGRQLGNIMMNLKQSSSAQEKFDETAMKTELLKLRDLTFNAPPDISADVVEKLKILANFADTQNLSDSENKFNLFKTFSDTLRAVKP